MAYKSVAYRKRLEARGELDGPVSIGDGISAIKRMAAVKADRTYKNGKKRKTVDQTINMSMHLGIDARQADQMLRGAISLPKGIGKARTVVAFCEGAVAEAAKAAGAVEAGGDELIEKVSGGWFEFDVAIAHPSMMGKVGKLGRVLGPQGKMPSPKAGTVTPDVATAVKEFAGGRLEFRNDDGGNVHLPVGKASFPDEDLKANVQAVIDHFTRIKPAAAKGHFFRRISLSTAHAPSVTVTPAAGSTEGN